MFTERFCDIYNQVHYKVGITPVAMGGGVMGCGVPAPYPSFRKKGEHNAEIDRYLGDCRQIGVYGVNIKL